MEPEPQGHFMRSEGHIRSWDIFPGTGVRAGQNLADFASMSELRIQSRSRSTLPGTRIGAAMTACSEPEPQPARIISLTPESEPEIPEIIDLLTTLGYKI